MFQYECLHNPDLFVDSMHLFLSADFALVGELNVLSIGSHISMAPMRTLDFSSMELGSIGDPMGIAFDPVESKLYWTDKKKGTITRARLNGADRQVVFANALGNYFILLNQSLFRY